jgi:hypothetical protein
MPAPAPVKQKTDAAFMESQQSEQAEAQEEVITAMNDRREGEVEQTAINQQAESIYTGQQPTEQTENHEKAIVETKKEEPSTKLTSVTQQTDDTVIKQQEEKKTETNEEMLTAEDDTKNVQQAVPDSAQHEPAEVILEKAEERPKPLNKNYYYGLRANGNWFEISNLRPNEFVMRYDTRTEDRSRFSFYEFALDSIGKLKREKVIAKASDLKQQPLLQLQLIDSMAMVYGMQAMDKPFSHVLQYTVDSADANNARFELYITGMPYNKKIEESKITEPFDFIVLDPWTGELINKGNGNAITDNDNELSIRMTTLIKNQDVQ